MAEYRNMYNKNYPSENDKTAQPLACVLYTYCQHAKRWLKNDLKDEIRPFIGRNYSHYD